MGRWRSGITGALAGYTSAARMQRVMAAWPPVSPDVAQRLTKRTV